jgi:hypothetical protein
MVSAVIEAADCGRSQMHSKSEETAVAVAENTARS